MAVKTGVTIGPKVGVACGDRADRLPLLGLGLFADSEPSRVREGMEGMDEDEDAAEEEDEDEEEVEGKAKRELERTSSEGKMGVGSNNKICESMRKTVVDKQE